MLVRSVADIRHQTIAVEHVHDLGEGQIHSNLLRHTKLIQIDVRIGRDNRTSREVHTLTHQVTAHTPGLRTETGLQSAERTTRPLSRGWQTLDVVVHIGRNIILDHRRILVDHLS